MTNAAPVPAPAPAAPAEKKKKKPGDDEPELSPEDQDLKDKLELCVTRIAEGDPGLASAAVQAIAEEVRSATTSMTAVPKPLKFLRSHYAGLVDSHAKLAATPAGKDLADVLSVLAITSGAEGGRESLKFRLQGAQGPVGAWGHEYVRNLAGEVGAEWAARRSAAEEGEAGAGGPPPATADLLELVNQIVPYHMAHNSEPEAVDLLLEVDRLDLLPPHVDAKNAGRTCLYLCACAPYLPEPDDAAALRCAATCYKQSGRDFDALRVALQLGDMDLVAATFAACADPATQVQLAYLLGRQGVALDFEDGPAAIADPAQRDACTVAASNSRAPERYLALARDLDVLEPRAPDDVYKLHLADGRPPDGGVPGPGHAVGR